MIDKLTTVPRAKLGEQIGQLADEDMVRLARAVFVFLGLAGA
jgi:mRNA interferase MazF